MIDSNSRINLDDPKISLIRHDSPESIFNEFWNFEKDLSFEELLEQTFGGIDGEGNEVEMPMSESFEAVKSTEFWGFSNSKTNTIHIWSAVELPPDTLRVLIGHEIGHLLEEQQLSEVPELADEQRADNYGKCTVLTERFLLQIISGNL
jgi:hypothetical protein